MIKIGMIIVDRYEILEKIGTGGMSDVYKAKCHKLNRFVAVKVLKQEFGENANFVSKFRSEAQAAAGLMHPNIVNVYDVGEENGIHFIVMELVEGITLKKYIEKKARLSVKEAISIAIQVSMGIESAHNNHIIHRDIKPQNIIISKEGKVKVTDFGIAKAATSNTITSNVMGSVHYTSPEQARGGYSDAKSDIYSLGITMFEMLTGRVPFNGETTVAIAIKHIQEELPSPREFVSEIPVSVEQIIFKCCEKSPDRRYQSMGELIADLKKSLINPDENFVKIVNPDEEASTRAISDQDMEQIKRETKRVDIGREQAMRLRRDVERDYEDDEDEDDEDEIEYKDDDEEEDVYDPKIEHLTTGLAIAAAVIIGCVVIFLVGRAFGLFNFSLSGSETQTEEATTEAVQVTMIQVIGKNIDDAKVELLNLGLTPEIQYEESTEYSTGIVMKSSVSEGESVSEGSNVVLTVSAGSEGISVPDVVGKTEAEASAILEKAGFVVNRSEGYDSYIKKGSVLSQSPDASSKAPAGTSVTIRVSLGEESAKIRVPNLIGSDEMDAMTLLTEAGLTMGAVTEVTNEDASLSGLVCYQSYSVGSYVEPGTVVEISISTGPAAATYKYADSISGPTVEEDANYKSGTLVTVTLTSADGTQLLSTQTTSFPIACNFTGIKAATGTILFQYVYTTEATVVTNEDGTTTNVEGTTENKEIRRAVTFTQE